MTINPHAVTATYQEKLSFNNDKRVQGFLDSILLGNSFVKAMEDLKV